MNEHARIAVVKVGGKEIAPGPQLDRFSQWAAREARMGRRLVIVHGGGDEVSERAAALGLPTEKRLGQRVTSAPMLEVVLEVLAGRVNARIVGRLNGLRVRAVGLSGLSGNLLTVAPAGDPPGSLGHVGRPAKVRAELLSALLGAGFVPVIAPIGADPQGRAMNVNADLAAGAIAKGLGADLWLVTDVPGVRDRSGALVDPLSVAEARRLVAAGIADGGMVPKLEAAEMALTSGNTVWIGDLDGLSASPRASGTTLRWSVVRPGRPAVVPARAHARA